MIEAAEAIVSFALPRTALDGSQRREMFALLNRHFEGVSPEQFAIDLHGKNHVILLRQGARLVGFSTLLVYETRFRGAPVSVVYSGDTIVAPEAWSSPVLSRTWISTVNRLRRDFPRGRYYWLLLASGFRTYRFLPVFWREFYPRWNRATPPATGELLEHLARERFGSAYESLRGLVRFPRPQRLRPDLAGIPPGKGADPHVAFFLAANPGHAAGDELVCLTELAESNLTRAGQRMVDRPVS